jgi:hypothetical protein
MNREICFEILDVCQPSVHSDSSPSQSKATRVRLFRLEIGISRSQLTIVVSSRRPSPPHRSLIRFSHICIQEIVNLLSCSKWRFPASNSTPNVAAKRAE